MSPWWLLPMLGALPLPVSAAEPVADTATLQGVVWGAPTLRSHGRSLAVFFDGRGHRCLADTRGLHCVDDSGSEVWGVDIEGVQDLLFADDELAVATEDGWQVLDRTTGATLESLGPDTDLVPDGAGGLARLDERGVTTEGGGLVAWPPDTEIDTVAITTQGAVGAIDRQGGLRWLGPEGPGPRLDLDLGRGGFLRTLALPDGGLAALDGDGLILLEPTGEIRAEVEIDGDALVFAEGELWVATPDGVLAVNAQTGVVDDEPVEDTPARELAVDGDALMVLDESGRVQSWQGDEPIGGDQHQGPVVALAPRGDGGLASVDTDGRVLVWSSTGRPRTLDVPLAYDVAWTPDGSLWIATDDGLVQWSAEAVTQPVDVQARTLVALPDGVLAGDGTRLVRLDADGATVWQTDLLHEQRPFVAEGAIVSARPDRLTVLDLKTGVRRRSLPIPDGGLHAAGVAVGGLVMVGQIPDSAGLSAGWRPGAAPPLGYPVDRDERAALSPDGRWVAWTGDRRDLVVRGLEGWPVLGRADRDADLDLRAHPGAIAVTAEHVWLGRSDGRIERWEVGEATGDTDLPPFGAYAQLDAFVPAPAGPEPTRIHDLTAERMRVAVHPDGRIAVGLPGLAEINPDGSTRVPALEPAPAAAAMLWDPRLGLIVAQADGQVLATVDDEVQRLGTAPGPVTDLCTTQTALVAAGPFGLWIRGDDGSTTTVAPPGEPLHSHVACSSDGGIVWEDGRQARRWVDGSWEAPARRHPGGSRSVAVLPNGSVATGGADETVVIWDTSRGLPLYVLEGHGGEVIDLMVDPDGRRLVAGGEAGAVVWDLDQLASIARLAPEVSVQSVFIDEQATRVWIAGTTGQLRQFTLPPPKDARPGATAADPPAQASPAR